MAASSNISFIIAAVDQFSQTFDQLDQQIERAYGAAGTLGAGMMAAGAAVGAGLGMAVNTAADFEAQMDKVSALTGATATEFNDLRDTALDLGATTSKSASEVAVAMQDMAAKGFEVNEVIDAMPGIIAAAEASGEDMALTANVVASALNGFGMEASNAGHVADVLAMAANQSAASIDDMGYAFKYAAAPAKLLGYSMEEIAVATGLMTDAGLTGESAGTTLRMALLRLVDPPKEAASAMERMGLDIMDAEGNMKPMVDVIKEFQGGLNGMTNAQKASTLATIFGAEAVSGMMTVLGTAPDKFAKLQEGLENSAGSAAKTSAIMRDNLKGALDELGGAFETAQISIGTALIPAIKAVAVAITAFINGFNALPKFMQNSIAIIAAVSSILLVLGGGILFIVSLIPNFMLGFTAIAGVLNMTAGALAVTIGWVFLAVAAIIALIVVIYQIWKNSEKFQAAFSKAMAAVMAAGKATFEWLKTAAAAVADVFVSKVIPAIQSFAEKTVAFFQKVAAVVAPILEAVVGKLKNFGSAAQDAFGKAMDFDFSGIAELAAKFIPSLIGYLIGGIPRLMIVGMNLLKAVADGMGITVPELMDKIVAAVTGMIDSFLAQLPAFLEAGIQIIVGLIDGILSQIPTLINMVTQIVQSITEILSTMLPQLMEAGVQILLTLIQGIVTVLPQVMIAAIQIFTTLLNAFIGMLPQLVQMGISLLNAIIGGIVGALPQIITAGITVLTTLIGGIVQVLPLLIQATIGLILAIVGALIKMLPAIIKAGIQILLALVDGLIKLLPILIDAALLLLFSIVDALIDNLPAIIDAGIKLVMALVDGLIQVLPILIQAAFKLVIEIAKGLIKMLPQILKAGVTIVMELVKGLISVIGSVAKAAMDIGAKILGELGKIDLVDIGRDIISGLIKGIGSMAGAVGKKIKEIAGGIPDGVKKLLNIHSPSRVMMALGGYTGEGLAIGIGNTIGMIEKSATKMAAAAVPNMGSVATPNFETVRRNSAENASNVTSGQQNSDGSMQQSAEYSFEIPVVVDGREIARATARFTKEELDRIENDKKRAQGVIR